MLSHIPIIYPAIVLAICLLCFTVAFRLNRNPSTPAWLIGPPGDLGGIIEILLLPVLIGFSVASTFIIVYSSIILARDPHQWLQIGIAVVIVLAVLMAMKLLLPKQHPANTATAK